MSKTLNEAMISTGSDFTYTETYRTYIESHLNYLREQEEAFDVPLDKKQVYKHLNDFTSLFLEMGIPYEDHYVMLRLNGFTSVTELTMDIETLKVIPGQVLATLKQLFRTVSGRV